MSQSQYHMIHDVYVLLDDGDRRVLRDFGLTLSQYRVLKSLDRERGRRLTTLSERLLRAKSTITRIVDQLEEEGWVQRKSDNEDRRAQRVILTQAGADLIERASAAHNRAVERHFDALSAQERVQFANLLEKLHNFLVQELYPSDDGNNHR